MRITTLEAGNPRQKQEIAREAAQVLHAGGLVVFPTETVYGVAASALSDEGVERLRKLKQSDASRAFTVHISEPADVDRFAEITNGAAKRLIAKSMPGPITVLVDVSDDVIRDRLTTLGLPQDQAARIYHQGVVGLRCPDHDLGRAVLAAGGPADPAWQWCISELGRRRRLARPSSRATLARLERLDPREPVGVF